MLNQEMQNRQVTQNNTQVVHNFTILPKPRKVLTTIMLRVLRFFFKILILKNLYIAPQNLQILTIWFHLILIANSVFS